MYNIRPYFTCGPLTLLKLQLVARFYLYVFDTTGLNYLKQDIPYKYLFSSSSVESLPHGYSSSLHPLGKPLYPIPTILLFLSTIVAPT